MLRVLFCHCECSEAISDHVGNCFLVPHRNDSKKLILSDIVRKTLALSFFKKILERPDMYEDVSWVRKAYKF